MDDRAMDIMIQRFEEVEKRYIVPAVEARCDELFTKAIGKEVRKQFRLALMELLNAPSP